MKYSPLIPFFTLFFLSVPTFSQVDRTCPYGTRELITITNIEDGLSGAFFDEPHLFPEVGIRTISILNENFTSIVRPTFEGTGPDTRILMYPIQPAFSNIVDLDGETSVSTNTEGLKVTLEDDSTFTCRIILSLIDTNNQKPIFRQSNLAVELPSSWDIHVPINYKFEDAIQVFDLDLNDAYANVEINGDGIRGTAIKRAAEDNPTSYRHLYDVQLFVSEVKAESYEVFATDGVNIGTESLKIDITVVEENLSPPVFKDTGYFNVFDKLPEIGAEVHPDIVATDPDNPMTTVTYTSDADFMVYEEGKFVFTKIDDLGTSKDVWITATEENEEAKNTTVKLSLKFPDPPIRPLLFTETYYLMHYEEDWPSAEAIIKDLKAEVEGVEGEELSFTGGGDMPPFIGITDSVLKFVAEVPEDGSFFPNKICVFDVEVSTPSERVAKATFVITFPLEDIVPTTTTENPPESTTESCDCSTCPSTTTPEPTTCPPPEECSSGTPPETTTPFDCSTCPPSTTENESSSSTTDEPPEGTSCPPPTTPEECTCPSSSTTTTTEPSGGTDCPPPITCPTTTTTEPCPTTPEECSCESCPTSSPTTCPPTTTTSGETCSPCPTTCLPCTTTTSSEGTCAPCPTTCPVCQTTTTLEPCECENSPSTCAPCDCDPTSTTSTCKPCPCDQDGDGEQDDCSNTGLLVAVIVTSALCAASICAAGYLVWLLRKATIDPTRIQRDNSFLVPKSDSVNDFYKPDTTSPSDNFRFGNENPRMSFGTGGGGGGGISTSADTVPNEPGITNPSFTMDQQQPTPRRFSVPKASLTAQTTTTATPTVVPSVSTTIPADDSSIYSQPIKKSNIKSPKEIEPDYEERPVQPERKVSVKPDSNNHIKFAPEDEYISIDKDEPPRGGDGDANVDLDSDSEYERL